MKSPFRLGLRARLIAAFVAIATITALVATLLTSLLLQRSLDDFVDDRTDHAATSAQQLAESQYRADGGWDREGLDRLSHELVLTGYDFRLVDDGRVLFDTTSQVQRRDGLVRLAVMPVRASSGNEVALIETWGFGPRGATAADTRLRRELERAHLLAAVLGGVLAAVVGLGVASWLSRPLRRLAGAARGMARGQRDVPPATGSGEIDELNDALRQLADDLDAQESSRRQLAEDLSHELRTPLMLLQSRIEAIQDDVVPFERAELATLHAEVLRLSRLVGQIERLAEAESGAAPLQSLPLSLDTLVLDVCRSWEPAFEAEGMEIEVHADASSAVGDPDAVRQIIANLLSNALRYAPDGKPIRVSSTAEGTTAFVRVQDSGTLDENTRQRVFERFFRSSEAGDGAAGLGLSIARELALRQGGSLTLVSETHGKTFELGLPAPEVEAAVVGTPGARG